MTTKTQLPKFTGKPLIEIPEYIPQANFLERDFGKSVLGEYQARAREDYSNNANLNVLTYQDNVVKGSNPFAVTLVNQIVSENGLRTASQADLEKILKTNVLDLRRHYEDSALALRNTEEPNSYLAKDLLKQIDGAKLPVMIPLNSLELRNDPDSNYGLAFNLKEDANIIYAPILNKESGYFSSEDIDENGLPKKTGEGDRYLYTRNSGLSGLFLNWGLGLDSYDIYLGDSIDDGRMVVVSGQGTNENFKF